MDSPFENERERAEALKDFERYLRAPEANAYFSIGVAYKYHGYEGTAKFFGRYEEEGRDLWEGMSYEVHKLLCKNGKPVGWADEVVSGDVRNLALGIISAIAASLDVTLGIAIPAAALVVKKGLLAFCASPLGKSPAVPIGELLRKRLKAHRRSASARKRPAPKRTKTATAKKPTSKPKRKKK